MRSKISFGSFFDISSSVVAAVAAFPLNAFMLLKAAVVVLKVCEVVTDPLSVVIN
jgi:hypothetical protein